MLWSTSRHGCYLRCDGGPFLPFSLQWPGPVHCLSIKTQYCDCFSLMFVAACRQCLLYFLLSGSGHNTAALCWCLCICWVLRVRGCQSCKSNIRARHTLHIVQQMHVFIWTPQNCFVCLPVSVRRVLYWLSGSGWAKERFSESSRILVCINILYSAAQTTNS